MGVRGCLLKDFVSSLDGHVRCFFIVAIITKTVTVNALVNISLYNCTFLSSIHLRVKLLGKRRLTSRFFYNAPHDFQQME